VGIYFTRRDFQRNPCLKPKMNTQKEKKSSSAIFKSPCSHPQISKGARHQKSMERKEPLEIKELKERFEK